jgi:hydroxypyruvate isomerase
MKSCPKKISTDRRSDFSDSSTKLEEEMKKSVNIEVLYTECPWKERFAMAKKDGFDFIEFWGWEDKNINELKKMTEENGIGISAMSGDGPLSMCDPINKKEYIAYIKQSLEIAEILNCSTLVIHSDSLKDSPQYAKPLSRDYSFTEKILAMYKTMEEITLLAEKSGITFVLEALNTVKDHSGTFLNSTDLSSDLVRAIGSEKMKILYDVYHMYLNEGRVCETIEKHVDVIGYIHIADAPGRGEPGTGAINYRNVFEYIKKTGYDKVVGFELYPAHGTKDAISAIRHVTHGI